MTHETHTPGPWYVYDDGSDEIFIGKYPSPINSVSTIAIAIGIMGEKENLANACLIAEAGTVATECGLTPRQLLDQRNELLEALEKISAGWGSAEDARGLMKASEVKTARAAIAKAKGETP